MVVCTKPAIFEIFERILTVCDCTNLMNPISSVHATYEGKRIKMKATLCDNVFPSITTAWTHPQGAPAGGACCCLGGSGIWSCGREGCNCLQSQIYSFQDKNTYQLKVWCVNFSNCMGRSSVSARIIRSISLLMCTVRTVVGMCMWY